MSPIEQIKAQFEKHSLCFEAYLNCHLHAGFVFSTPSFFAMGRPVDRHATPRLIRNPGHSFAPDDCNAWWVHGMAGDTHKVWDILPWPLGFIGWERFDEDLRFYPTESLRRLCGVGK